ncbi:MAG: hypothetical protein Q9198_000066 [Flavoplaca austrocitrina]
MNQHLGNERNCFRANWSKDDYELTYAMLEIIKERELVHVWRVVGLMHPRIPSRLHKEELTVALLANRHPFRQHFVLDFDYFKDRYTRLIAKKLWKLETSYGDHSLQPAELLLAVTDSIQFALNRVGQIAITQQQQLQGSSVKNAGHALLPQQAVNNAGHAHQPQQMAQQAQSSGNAGHTHQEPGSIDSRTSALDFAMTDIATVDGNNCSADGHDHDATSSGPGIYSDAVGVLNHPKNLAKTNDNEAGAIQEDTVHRKATDGHATEGATTALAKASGADLDDEENAGPGDEMQVEPRIDGPAVGSKRRRDDCDSDDEGLSEANPSVKRTKVRNEDGQFSDGLEQGGYKEAQGEANVESPVSRRRLAQPKRRLAKSSPRYIG